MGTYDYVIQRLRAAEDLTAVRAQDLCEELGMCHEAFNQRLNADGCYFRDMLKAERCRRVKQVLCDDPKAAPLVVANAAGYTKEASLYRMVKDYFGYGFPELRFRIARSYDEINR